MDNTDPTVALAALDAKTDAFEFVAYKLGIVVLASRDIDATIAVFFYNRKNKETGEWEICQLHSKSHNKINAIASVLNGIEDMTKCQNMEIRLVHRTTAMELMRERLDEIDDEED